MRNGNVLRRQWIRIAVGLFSFLTMFIYLIEILISKESFYFIDLGQNVQRSFPFVFGSAYVDYLLIKYINRAAWRYNHLISQVIFEFTALSALALVFP